MTLPIRYRAEVGSKSGEKWRIEILDVDWPGAVLTFKTAGDKFVLSYDADGTGVDRFDPIIESNLKFTVLWHPSDSSLTSFVNNLVEAQESRFYVRLRRKVGLTYGDAWYGKLIQDDIQYEDTATYRHLKLTAVCGLASLKAKDWSVTIPTPAPTYPVPLTSANFVEIVHKCLREALDIDLWADGDSFLKTCVRWFEDDMSAATVDPLRHTALRTQNLFWRIEDSGEYKYESLFDILELIAKNWGARIYMANGMWNFMQVAAMRTGSITRFEYDRRYETATGDPDDDGLTGASFIVENTAEDILLAPSNYFADGIYTFLPAVKEVRLRVDIGQLNYALSGLVNDPDTVSAQTNIGTLAPVGTIPINITVSLECYGLSGGSSVPTGTTTTACTFTIKHGSDYLDNSGAWVVGATTLSRNLNLNLLQPNEVEVLPYQNTFTFVADAPSSSDTLSLKFDFTLPYTATGATVAYVKCEYATTQGQKSSLYVATNTTNPNSSYIVDLGNVEIGDFLNTLDLGSLTIWNGTSFEDSDAWQFEKTGTAYEFNTMRALDFLRGQKYPTKKYTGAWQDGFISYTHVMQRGSALYIPMRTQYNGRLGEWQGEWFFINYETTGITTTDEEISIEPNEIGVGTPPIFYKAANTGNTINQIASLSADIDLGDTVTSVSVTGLGTALLNGDTFSIYDPQTETLQSFTVGSDSGTGTTDITVSSTTATANFPAGLPVIFSGLNLHKKLQAIIDLIG